MRELVQVGLAEYDDARLAQSANHERVLTRVMPGEGEQPAGGWQIGGVEVVLDDDRNAVQWAAHLPVATLAIQPRRVRARPRIEPEHGVELGTPRVVGGDARQICVDELDRRDFPRRHRGLQLRDRRLYDVRRGRDHGWRLLGRGL